MRKDVKIGLAIGGIVLAVLIVYVLKVPNEQNKEAQQTEPQKVAQTEPDIAMAPPSTQPAQVTVGGPATQPSQLSNDPFAAHPTTMPSGDALSATPTHGDRVDWGTALSTGQMSLSASSQTRTTDAGSSGIISRARAAGDPTDMVQPPQTLGSRTHTVQKGETLSSIAQVAYGNAGLYTLIVKANPKINPAKVRPGTVLVLPEATKGERSTSAGGTAAAPGAATAALDSKHYKVQPGDSLQKIAAKLYGASDKWEKIYDLNKSKIGADPHRIKAEMVLALPDEPAVAAH